MKLNELLQNLSETSPGWHPETLTHEILETIKEQLNQCEELQGSEIEIIPKVNIGSPRRVIVGQDDEGPIFEVRSDVITQDNEIINTYKYNTKLKFGPKVKIFSIGFTPTIYDPNAVFNTPADSVFVYPITYDTKTFKPLKRVILTYSPEQAQDAAMGILKGELKKMDEDSEKQEFIVSNPDQIEATTKHAEDMMQVVNKDDIAALIKEEENKYIEALIEKVKSALTCGTNEYNFPGKRSILLRMTADSVSFDDSDVREEEDTYVRS